VRHRKHQARYEAQLASLLADVLLWLTGADVLDNDRLAAHRMTIAIAGRRVALGATELQVLIPRQPRRSRA